MYSQEGDDSLTRCQISWKYSTLDYGRASEMFQDLNLFLLRGLERCFNPVLKASTEEKRGVNHPLDSLI